MTFFYCSVCGLVSYTEVRLKKSGILWTEWSVDENGETDECTDRGSDIKSSSLLHSCECSGFIEMYEGLINE